MMASAPTLGDAFRDYVGLQIGYSRGAMVYLQNIGDDTLLGYGLYAFPGAGRQINDLVLAIGCNMVRSLTGGRADPLPTPASVGQPINIAPYRSALKTTTLFDQEHTAVEVSARDMALPLPGADPARRLQLRTGIQKTLWGDLEDNRYRWRFPIQYDAACQFVHRTPQVTRQQRSTMTAMPCPPPMHKVTSP